MRVFRGIIPFGARQMHFRMWGRGPAVFLLHGSPQSSASLVAQARAIAARGLCAIAVDTPGNGLSTPLPVARPTIDDYATALLQFADRLGVRRFGLYGFHTGASIACAVAAFQPGRVSAVAFDGLSCWTEEERSDLLANYLPPFSPSWDGAHMTWLWARLEEQAVFFPWYTRSDEARVSLNMPPLGAMQMNAIDFLDSGDGYRVPYHAAFEYRATEPMSHVSIPFVLASTRHDPLVKHLRRAPLTAYAPKIYENQAALMGGALELFAANPGDDGPAPESVAEQGASRGFIRLGDEDLAWSGVRRGSGRPLLLLHSAGGSGREFNAALNLLSGDRSVIALDLPGHGASHEGWAAAPASIESYAEVVLAACKALGIDRPDVAGIGFGGCIAAQLGAMDKAASETFLGPKSAGGGAKSPIGGRVSLAPEWDGAHLVRAFRIARYEKLYAPWNERNASGALPTALLDLATIQGRAIDLIKAHDRWNHAVEAEMHYDVDSLGSANVRRLPEQAQWAAFYANSSAGRDA